MLSYVIQALVYFVRVVQLYVYAIFNQNHRVRYIILLYNYCPQAKNNVHHIIVKEAQMITSSSNKQVKSNVWSIDLGIIFFTFANFKLSQL